MAKKEKSASRELFGEAAFSVSARVAMQLGRESISSSIVAILELVKNSYDADAEHVHILFRDIDTENAVLIIDDDGSGMSHEELIDNWMVIGTSNKAELGRSKNKKRILIGEKGLGRLGLDRLGARAIVQSFKWRSRQGVRLDIDWKKYEDADTRLEKIKHPIYKIPKKVIDPSSMEPKNKPKGTRLTLHGLRDTWTREDIQHLRQELSLLVSPFVAINDFTISLDSGMAWPEVDGPVTSEEMLEAAEWIFSSTLDTDHTVSHKMIRRDGTSFEFRSTWPDIFKSLELPNPLCGPLKFNMYFYPREAVKELSLDLAQIRRFLTSNQGIRIYRDDFRVKPYGEPSGEGDWLNLAYRRVQNPGGVRSSKPWKVGYNQVVGAVFLTRANNEDLLDQTNREGIVQGQPFFDLRIFALHGIEFFEDRRQRFERSQVRKTRFDEAKIRAEATLKSTKAATKSLEKVVESGFRELGEMGVQVLPKVRTSLVEAVREVAKVTEDAEEAREELVRASDEQEQEFKFQKDTLGNLASLGILAATFGHETLSHANLVLSNIELLKINLTEIHELINQEALETMASTINDLEFGAKRIDNFAEFTLKNIRRDKRKRKKVYLDRVIRDVLKSFEYLLEEQRGIHILVDLPRKQPILAFHIDWESILINLITNSVWALENTRRPDRVIRIRLQQSDNILQLSFADSGIGIEAGTIDRIFEPTFSTKRDQRGNIIGTGMGLAIVENLVKGYGGGINVESPSDLGGAEFHINIPIPSLRGRRRRK